MLNHSPKKNVRLASRETYCDSVLLKLGTFVLGFIFLFHLKPSFLQRYIFRQNSKKMSTHYTAYRK